MIEQIPYMSDSQKDHLDVQLETILRQTLTSIQQLGKYTVGTTQTFLVRQSIIKILEVALMQASGKQKEMHDYRLKEITKVRSVLLILDSQSQ
jgi:hypothetical protein